MHGEKKFQKRIPIRGGGGMIELHNIYLCPFFIVVYYINWVKFFWTDRITAYRYISLTPPA